MCIKQTGKQIRKGGNFLTVSLMVEFHASCDENMSFIGYGIFSFGCVIHVNICIRVG